MNSRQLVRSEFTIPADYPEHFKDALNRQKRQFKTTSRSVVYERLTITDERLYLPVLFTKMYHDKEVFGTLTPAACKIVVHIACNLSYMEARVQLSPKLTGLSKYLFRGAVLELLTCGLLAKQQGKREWYWINLATLVSGDPHT